MLSGILNTLRAVLSIACCLAIFLALPTQYASSTMENPMEKIESSLERNTSPDVDDLEIDELVSRNTEFAFDLYRALKDKSGGNMFYSPYSISIALAMTYAGARGDTADEMADTLHFTLDNDRLHPAFNMLDIITESRAKPDEWDESMGFKLNIANSIWGQEGRSFLPEFLDILAANYGAGMRLVDFINAAEDARVAINNWVEDKTEGRIKDLLAPGVVDSLTRLVLVNAIYFNAPWAYPFMESKTKADYFHPIDAAPVLVPMMHKTENFRCGMGDGYTAVQLPYERFQIGMLIMMPDEGRFAEFEDSLDAARMGAIINGLGGSEVILTMPKFKYESSFSLAEVLAGMGMPIAFSGSADFSGMDGTHDLFISDVIHKAFVKADEEGTEAAAATAVVMTLAAAPGDEPEPIVITIDKPFIFAIWDFETKSILFIGRVMNPSE